MVRSMRLTVTVKVRAHEERVEWVDATHAVVHVRQSPHDGLANAAVLKTLARTLRVGIGQLRMVRGFRGKSKVIEVD